jgi:hypothetical protein
MFAASAYRGSGEGRPDGIALPPGPMPLMLAGRLLKQWRYIGFYSSELSLCAGAVRVGPFRQSFWAVWDRRTGRLAERTKLSHRGMHIEPGLLRARDRHVQIDLRLDEGAGIEVVTPYGEGYVWTRKQACVAARGSVVQAGNRRVIEGEWAFVDDWAGYPPRHTRWEWSAGVGIDTAGRRVGWNLVSGINDDGRGSERTIWIDAQPHEIAAVAFAPDLAGVGFANGDRLAFKREAVRRRRENLLLIRSDYEQPFGTFSGRLPGGSELREGYGVMERHDAVW